MERGSIREDKMRADIGDLRLRLQRLREAGESEPRGGVEEVAVVVELENWMLAFGIRTRRPSVNFASVQDRYHSEVSYGHKGENKPGTNTHRLYQPSTTGTTLVLAGSSLSWPLRPGFRPRRGAGRGVRRRERRRGRERRYPLSVLVVIYDVC